MTIDDLKISTLNPAIAYVVGLAFPLYRETNDYVIAAVCYNYHTVPPVDMSTQRAKIENLCSSYMCSFSIVSNSGLISKDGFSLLIDKNDRSTADCKDILFNIVRKILASSEDIKKSFIRGCFDGRASFDTSRHFLSVDVDRDYNKQDIIYDICNSLNISVQLNRRDPDYPKNDQIRIRPEDLEHFIDTVGLYSISRTNAINAYLI